MNDYFLGLLTAVVFFVALLFFFWLGTRYGKKPQPPPSMEDERRKEIERYNKHFKALFNYDVDKARQRKKVT
jgi:hypothetical protein